MDSVNECYKVLSRTVENAPSKLKEHSSSFACHLKAMHESSPETFGVVPKLHQFLELCSFPGRPAPTWNYRDEDFGERLAHMCGNWNTSVQLRGKCT
eukprot:6160602-Amphidinium_carterae.2